VNKLFIEFIIIKSETNLKVRQGLPETANLTNANAVSEIRGMF